MPTVGYDLRIPEDPSSLGSWDKRDLPRRSSILLSCPNALEFPQTSARIPLNGRGVYFLHAGDPVVYVGQSTANILTRIGQHIARMPDVDSYRFLPVEGDWPVLNFVESYWIHRLRPRYNHGPMKSGHYHAPLDYSMTMAILETYIRVHDLRYDLATC